MTCDFCNQPIEFHHKDGLEVCKFHRDNLCEQTLKDLKYFLDLENIET